VFDSSVPWEEKAPHIENAEALEASHAAYADAGEGLGGITVEVTSESVDDTTASVVYSLLFGGAPAYSDIDGSLTRVDDTWIVTEAEFCGFLASARTPCES
jgi:iron complex transport system substrate-binding protein